MDKRKKKDFIKKIKKEPTVMAKKRLLQKIAYGDDSIKSAEE